MKTYDYLIVGAGLFGAIFASEMERYGKTCLVIDKRDHIGGNCYTKEMDELPIHKYGPHIFHTDNENIWNWINKFTKFNNFINRPKVTYKHKIYSFPINLFTFHQQWGVNTPEEAKKKIQEMVEPIKDPKNLEEYCLSKIGRVLYNIFIKGYTEKQWQTNGHSLPISIIKRIPIRFDFNDNYYDHKYQGVPEDGYTKIFTKLLDGVEVKLSTDYFNDRLYFNSIANKVVYTGRLDEFYDYKLGNLEYRTNYFVHETSRHIADKQGVAIMNYTDVEVPYTRTIEHKHFYLDKYTNLPHSVLTYEIPKKYEPRDEPLYPINNEKNNVLYNAYLTLAKNENNFIFGGRLADYKYYDMHQVIAEALHKSKKEHASES